MRTGLITRAVSDLERIINRQVLGLQPDPEFWPPPSDPGCLALPEGIDVSDACGRAWSLDSEFTNTWHRRRTAVGAHAYRFQRNSEYDCGWRLADASARFLKREGRTDRVTLLTIVPPAPVYSRVCVLPWLGQRLAELLQVQYLPDAFEMTRPLPGHPDEVPGPNIMLGELYRIGPGVASQLADQRVLLADWRFHSGRTLTTLARLLQRNCADVVRFTWLQ